jgi:hypothetical protein
MQRTEYTSESANTVGDEILVVAHGEICVEMSNFGGNLSLRWLVLGTKTWRAMNSTVQSMRSASARMGGAQRSGRNLRGRLTLTYASAAPNLPPSPRANGAVQASTRVTAKTVGMGDREERAVPTWGHEISGLRTVLHRVHRLQSALMI